jgi:tRNA A-37 threonylcarbamoyl transferase component Bud32
MTSDADALRGKLIAAVQEAMEALVFSEAKPVRHQGTTVSAELTQWSWVRITEPCPGMVAVALTTDLLRRLCASMLGQEAPAGSVGANDCQSELTNILAGRLMSAVSPPNLAVGIGLPRTGRGAPNVKEPGWMAQEFTLDDQHFAVFVHGAGLSAMASARGKGTTVTRGVTAVDAGNAASAAAARSGERTPAPGSGAPDTTVVAFAEGEGRLEVGAVAAVPETLAGYRILERLGDGGMGVIYKARHQTLDRLAALKVMRPELAQNERFVQRFLREARIAAAIDHPNVVPVFDAGIQDGHLFIAMRFVPGGDLSQLMRERGPLPQGEALVLIANCLLGLQAIADAGLVHRDIKPANILLDADGNPRLADLGLARSIDTSDPSGAHLTQAGSIQGTPAYMAPEQARGAADLDVRADIYAFGATLYALLAGQPAFAGASVYETIAQVLTREPESLLTRKITDQRGPIHPEVNRLVMKAMAKEPAARPQTPADFIAEISAILQLPGVMDGVPPSTSASGRQRAGAPAPGEVAPGEGRARRTPSGDHWLARLLRRK